MRTTVKTGSFSSVRRPSRRGILLFLALLGGVLAGRAAPVWMSAEAWQDLCGMVVGGFSHGAEASFGRLYTAVFSSCLAVEAAMILSMFHFFALPLVLLLLLCWGMGAGAGATALLTVWGSGGMLFFLCVLAPCFTAAALVYLYLAEAAAVFSGALLRMVRHSARPDLRDLKETARKLALCTLVLGFCSVYYALMRLYVILPPG